MVAMSVALHLMTILSSSTWLQIKMVIEGYFFVLNKKAHGGYSLELPQQCGFTEYKFYIEIIRASKHAYTLSLGSKNFVTAFILLSRRCP